MSPTNSRSYEQYAVTIPADIERPDRVLAGLNLRQLAILAPGLVLIWVAYLATDQLLPLPVFAAMAIPVAGAVAALALVQRDGIGLDQLAAHAVSYARAPRRLVPAPEPLPVLPAWATTTSEESGPVPVRLRLPARAIGARGTIDLGPDGIAVIVACTTVSFALRTPSEQAGLVAAFGGWLNALTGPTQILVQAAPIDLSPAITDLRQQAAGLPHPALEAAALDHAHFLTELASTRDLLARRVLIVIREPTNPTTSNTGGAGVGGVGGRGQDANTAVMRALRRAEQTTRALAGAGIAAAVLDADQATAVLAAAADPTAPAMAPGIASADEPITTATDASGREVG